MGGDQSGRGHGARHQAVTDVEIRLEAPDDFEAIREVNRLAFEGEAEAALVDRLRAAGLFVASLVAVERSDNTQDESRAPLVVGHILFSRLAIHMDAGVVPAVALAPLAVVPDRQRRGIGSLLVDRGLAVCRDRGEAIAIVLGHPGYYPRFGFSPALARPLRSPFSGDAFMALELRPRALDGLVGEVRYPAAFDAFA